MLNNEQFITITEDIDIVDIVKLNDTPFQLNYIVTYK